MKTYFSYQNKTHFKSLTFVEHFWNTLYEYIWCKKKAYTTGLNPGQKVPVQLQQGYSMYSNANKTFFKDVFFPKWEVSDSIHVFICEAGVKRMLLKIKLRWCAAQTCAEVYYEACWGALNEAWVSLPRSARPVLTPNERLCISPLQCLTVITRSHRVGIIIFNTLLITRPKHLVENQDVVITLP